MSKFVQKGLNQLKSPEFRSYLMSTVMNFYLTIFDYN